MFKRIMFIVCVGTFLFGTVGLSYSQQEEKDDMSQVMAQKIEVGNKICPVTGEEIDEKTKATYEYEGKVYNFCCVMCIDTFKNDPQKYIRKVDEELQAKAGKLAGQ